MIYLTKTDEEKTKVLINSRKIITIEKTITGSNNIHMDSGKIFTVLETEAEIIEKIELYEVNVIRKAIVEAKRV